MENEQKLVEIFSTSLGISPDIVTDDLKYNEIAEWDSVAHMALVSEMETQFGLMLNTDDIIDMSSVGMAKSILAKHGVMFENTSCC